MEFRHRHLITSALIKPFIQFFRFSYFSVPHEIEMLKNSKLTSIIFRIIAITICTLRLLEQVQHVSQRYFEYRTRTIISVMIPAEDEYPSISLCFRYHDMLDRHKITIKYPHLKLKRYRDPKFDSQKFFEATANFTISELFNFTANVDGILAPEKGCIIRYPSKLTTDSETPKTCYERFIVKKYLVRQDVCYLFIPRITDEMLQLHEYTLAAGFPAEMYTLLLDKSIFRFFGTLSVAIHSNESAFIPDITFASSIDLRTENLPTTSVYHRKLIRTSLPYPYDTKCRHWNIGLRSLYAEQFRIIDQKAMEMYNFSVPFYPTFNSSINVRKLINYRAFKNGPARQQVVDLVEQNLKLTDTCYQVNFITKSQFVNDEGSAFTAHWTRDENFISLRAPEQELLDYIVYVCSCIGIWFGLSAYSVFDAIKPIFIPYHDRIQEHDKLFEIQHQTIFTLEKRYQFVCKKLDLIQRFNERLFDLVNLQ